MRKSTALLILLSSGFLAACDEGPAEEFGENLDDATEDVRDSIEDTADEIDNQG